jgi:hypothetical protein
MQTGAITEALKHMPPALSAGSDAVSDAGQVFKNEPR